MPFDPHSPTPGKVTDPKVNGLASVQSGCMQCHGARVALHANDGGALTVDDLKPGPDGLPTNAAAVARIARDDEGRPILTTASWPNTGIGRLNLDGSRGSCAACHSRHDFSPRRARQPENCGKCHLGPDHPQKEIYEESKHGVAYRDLKDQMNLDARPGCSARTTRRRRPAPPATCRPTPTGCGVTHDPGERISWTNRPPISLVMDTDATHAVVTETDPAKRAALVADTAAAKRDRMKKVCTNCHTPELRQPRSTSSTTTWSSSTTRSSRKPGAAIMAELAEQGLITKTQFDEEIEWEWYFLWHHEGRRARHGAAMMAPDYTHWHGMYEVADRFYQKLIPEAREITHAAAAQGRKAQAEAVDTLIDAILARPEHAWSRPEAPTPAAPK